MVCYSFFTMTANGQGFVLPLSGTKDKDLFVARGLKPNRIAES